VRHLQGPVPVSVPEGAQKGGGIVIIFVRVSLFIFAVCGFGGLLAMAAAAATTPDDRIGALVLLAICFWVEVVLVLAAVSL